MLEKETCMWESRNIVPVLLDDRNGFLMRLRSTDLHSHPKRGIQENHCFVLRTWYTAQLCALYLRSEATSSLFCSCDAFLLFCDVCSQIWTNFTKKALLCNILGPPDFHSLYNSSHYVCVHKALSSPLTNLCRDST